MKIRFSKLLPDTGLFLLILLYGGFQFTLEENVAFAQSLPVKSATSLPSSMPVTLPTEEPVETISKEESIAVVDTVTTKEEQTKTTLETPSSIPVFLPQSLSEKEAQVEQALWNDLAHMVRVQQNGGWDIDRYEIESLMPNALLSVCQVSPEIRESLFQKLSDALALLPSAKSVWQQRKKLSKIRKQLLLFRMKALLFAAHQRAKTECPFYLEPDDSFRGLRSESHRFSFHVETGGIIQLQQSASNFTYGGGGTGRLLIGRGFDSLSLLLGVELAGGALLDLESEEAGQFVINYFAAIPVVLRRRTANFHYEIELAPAAHLLANDLRPSFGSRLGVAFGVQSHKTRGILPWAGLAFAWEHFFPGPRAAEDFLRAGFRVGFIFN